MRVKLLKCVLQSGQKTTVTRFQSNVSAHQTSAFFYDDVSVRRSERSFFRISLVEKKGVKVAPPLIAEKSIFLKTQ